MNLPRFRIVLILAGMTLSAAGLFAAEAAPPAGEKGAPPRSFEKLVTDDGVEYVDCEVVRVEPDALVVRHRKGVARLSFFDLPREIREAYQFDPFLAVEHFRKENERQRQLRWQGFWEKQRYEAAQAEKEANKRMIEDALSQWIPVEATVTRSADDRFLARCRQVIFVKTTKRSKLGFLVDGPPKRKLVDFAGGKPIWLRLAAQPERKLPVRGATWKGYVCPYPDPKPTEADADPVFRAVTLP